MSVIRRLIVLLVLPMILPVTVAHAGPQPSAHGCHRSLPVVAHYAGGKTVKRAVLPVACVTETGFATSESSITVNNRGAIFYSPANSENTLARSSDHGVTWNLVQP